MKRVIYFRRLPSAANLAKFKERFHFGGITVNGEAIATVDPGDGGIFQKCADMGFFEIRNKQICN